MAENWYIRDDRGVDLRKSITVIMLELLTLSRATGIWPQRDVVKYIRSAIALDGLIKSLAPGFNVGHHLETVCDRHLHWHAVRTLMSPSSIFGWLEAGSRLARDGMSRTVGVMAQMVSPAASHSSGLVRRSSSAAVVRIAAFALLCSILAVIPHGPMTWGVNLRSASVFLVLAAIFLALWKMFRGREMHHAGISQPIQLPNVY
jgi:hypothetical protein